MHSWLCCDLCLACMRSPCSMLLLRASLLCSRLSCSRTLSWWASYSSRLGYILEIRASKFGSARRERLDTSFFLQVGHSLFLQRKIIKGQKRARNIWLIDHHQWSYDQHRLTMLLGNSSPMILKFKRKTLVLPWSESGDDALGAEAMQTLFGRHGVFQHVQTNGTHKLTVEASGWHGNLCAVHNRLLKQCIHGWNLRKIYSNPASKKTSL